jgi:hypothetical protein
MTGIEMVLRRFIDAMSTLKMDYVIIGGFAIAAWGRPRATIDIDVIVDLKEEKIEAFVGALRRNGFSISAVDVVDAIKNREHFSIFDVDSSYHVDAKGIWGKNEARTLSGRKMIKYEDVGLPISGLEDTIANKLRFGREQDIEDAFSLMIFNRDKLDRAKLEKLCIEVGVGADLKALERKAAGATAPKRHGHTHHRHR